MEEAREIILLEALKNAYKFGKANIKAVMGKIMKEKPEYRRKAKEIKVLVGEIIDLVNSWDHEKIKSELEKLDPSALEKEEKKGPEEKILPDLPNAKIGDKKNPVVMRLAPYPSGALHIGNARMIILNDEYVKKYKGRLILCFDDTIGTSLKQLKENRDKAKFVIPEAYDLILEGLDWLGVDYDKNDIKYKSDRVDIYKNYAQQFIENNYAYVCTCAADEFREKYKKWGKPCPCRNLGVNEHLDRWQKMLDGTYAEGAAVVRLKTGMDQKDPAVRDHIIMRISDAEHPRIGNKTRVWPLLDFSWGIDDHEFGITHIIRGADLRKEGFIEEFIWKLMGWPKKEIILYGRLKFSKEFKLSKTEARINIEKGIYDGWHDPRTWSLQSLEARGIQPEALRKALIELGLSISGINFSAEWIYSKNVKLIDPIANRYWFVENPIPLKIKNLEKSEYISTPLLNPHNPKLGTRKVVLKIKNNQGVVFIDKNDIKTQYSRKGNKIRYPQMKEGDIFRLKDLFTIELTKVDLKSSEPYLESKYLTSELDKHIRKIQWVPKNDYIKADVLKPNGIVMHGYAESNVKNLKKGDIIQFERYGFVRIQNISERGVYSYYTH
ncbi:MAG: glutamate--tRNA ligase [Promethearchaeota archaeon]